MTPGDWNDSVISAPAAPSHVLPAAKSVLAVCAHPDDESFGLGGIIVEFAGQGADVSVLCFTHGEASTLGHGTVDLGEIRSRELREAGQVLGVRDVTLLGFTDGELAERPLPELVDPILRVSVQTNPDLLLVFDEGGITGHPDHERATEAALVAARELDVPVLAWVLPLHVTLSLNREFGTTFAGRPLEEVDFVVSIDRGRQLDAIGRHESQASENPVLWRRLELQAGTEWLRWLSLPRRRAGSASRRR